MDLRLERFRDRRKALEGPPPPDGRRAMAVTQIRVAREHVDFLTRVSAVTRLHAGRYLMRIDILRLLVDELIAGSVPAAGISSFRSLVSAIASHLSAARRLPDRPVAWLASCLESEAGGRERRPVLDFPRRRPASPREDSPAAAHESLTVRLSTSDLVALDTFRCDVREQSGFILSRSALFRALVEAFVRSAAANAPVRPGLPPAIATVRAPRG